MASLRFKSGTITSDQVQGKAAFASGLHSKPRFDDESDSPQNAH
ncbi:MAG: hypothetical protein AAF764_00500 [Pseudomonadota bacterium]